MKATNATFSSVKLPGMRNILRPRIRLLLRSVNPGESFASRAAVRLDLRWVRPLTPARESPESVFDKEPRCDVETQKQIPAWTLNCAAFWEFDLWPWFQF